MMLTLSTKDPRQYKTTMQQDQAQMHHNKKKPNNPVTNRIEKVKKAGAITTAKGRNKGEDENKGKGEHKCENKGNNNGRSGNALSFPGKFAPGWGNGKGAPQDQQQSSRRMHIKISPTSCHQPAVKNRKNMQEIH